MHRFWALLHKAYLFWNTGWHPPVGVFIAVLGLVGVLVPWLRARMGNKEKAFWTLLMFLFVLLEIRSIYEDRREYDAQRAQATAQQIANFNRIAGGIDKSIAQSQSQFNVTVAQLESNLTKTQEILNDTQPHAFIRFTGFALDDLNLGGPTVAVGSQIRYNMWYTNIGNETAVQMYYDVKFYIDKADDKETQKRLAADFEEWWKKSKHHGGGIVQVNTPSFNTISTDKFTKDQVEALANFKKTGTTIYTLIRFSYSDHTGRWFGDYCIAMQDPHDLRAGHNCSYHNNDRYSAK